MGMASSIGRFFRWLRLALSGWGIASAPHYHHFRNIILPTTKRGTTEIDHLIVSPFGLFVIENKNRSGWIFGEEFAKSWTSVNFKRKYQFQNPLHQNFGHVKALEELLGIDVSKIHQAVVFRGRFKFKTPVPKNVFLYSCASWVGNKTEVLLSDEDVNRVLGVLQDRAVSGVFAARRHAVSVKRKYRSATTCPKCGGELVHRIAKRGPMPGSRFVGCSNYPACKYVRH
jgi:restriction system protein